MPKYKGWAGKILRVNLTNGSVTAEDTADYIDYIGGMGFGYKILWDEVPAGTDAFDEANKIVIGAGPITGTGVPCTARTNITSLLPMNPYNLVGDGHMGGHFSPEMKYAGWDAIIIEGKSNKPVWLRIEDDKVTIEDASRMWGQGIFDTTAQVASIMGKEAQIAAIGQAGENLVRLSNIMTNGNHSAGGHGAVFGSKKLKAIGIIGTGSVKYAADTREWIKLNDHVLSIIGANNQHVVPSTPQPWAEYHDPNSRWTAQKGLYWGAADKEVETGICEPKNINKIGFRTMKAIKDLGEMGEEHTVRMGGCQSCPVRCHSHLEVPELEKYGKSRYVANTCMGYSSHWYILKNADLTEKATFITKTLGAQLADDYGLWFNYGQLGRDLWYAYNKGILKDVLPADEYNSIPWDKYEAGDPDFLVDFYRRLAYAEGELSHISDGSARVAKRWGFEDDYWDDVSMKQWSPVMGYPLHHANESNGQVGSLINLVFNRDPMCHSHQNFIHSGLPIKLNKEIAAEVWGSEAALDIPANYTPMNEYKAKFAKWSLVKNALHDSMTVCNWMFPMVTSPLKERNYRGDTTIEAQYFSLTTGMDVSEEELDEMGERIITLHRALTVKQMGTTDMRNEHDQICNWVFDMDPDKKAFDAGTIKMDRDDMEKAKTMFYKEMGWDGKTGAPTYETLERLGMKEVADELDSMGLIPG
ncbi:MULTISPECIES: aldehyde ferredoxin oxidoreductase [unclassified Halanaerobium]|uniref:aldehyde ferredoxin oxidoreductase n=1 Tax=unclassified Halanaerobium TaxID=2641197 RepID=UPI000DF21D8F|nr:MULTISPECIES: aldehyde ferredoxin oxidoreductase [unclassified Halanaerobium]RCW40620.1 aldehyde:ferredoxin oxidoreductase [Halanaerobium sp. MA284_MarDTE_T2]RCW87994.1 aldehyde:ferredoxin oxidoreductase [Halanaerobium sp. DL-01]